MAAYATPTRLGRRTLAYGNLVLGIVRCWRNWSTIQNSTRRSTLLAQPKLGPPLQAVLFARARLLLHIQWRSMTDIAQDPETDVPDWLHSGVPLVYGCSTAVGASRLCRVACGARWDPSSHRDCESPEEASERVKPDNERLLSKSHVRTWPSWEAIRLRWPSCCGDKTGLHR